jgi:hypothetical protein
LTEAVYHGTKCTGCGGKIALGELIRSDEEGGWLHESCEAG